MTGDEWDAIQRDAVAALAPALAPFVTPISMIEAENAGSALGSGGFVRWGQQTYLLTANHVAENQDRHSLAFSPFDSDSYLRVQRQFIGYGEPLDVAVCPIPEAAWNEVQHCAAALPVDRIAPSHGVVQGELYFIMGYSGSRSYFSPMLSSLFSTGTPYLTQDITGLPVGDPLRREITHPAFDPNVHFALFYEPENARAAAPGTTLPGDAHGFSGSLVWNTHIVRCLSEGVEWDANLATLTGIVWGWPTADRCLLATKIEHVRDFMQRASDRYPTEMRG